MAPETKDTVEGSFVGAANWNRAAGPRQSAPVRPARIPEAGERWLYRGGHTYEVEIVAVSFDGDVSFCVAGQTFMRPLARFLERHAPPVVPAPARTLDECVRQLLEVTGDLHAKDWPAHLAGVVDAVNELAMAYTSLTRMRWS